MRGFDEIAKASGSITFHPVSTKVELLLTGYQRGAWNNTRITHREPPSRQAAIAHMGNSVSKVTDLPC